MLHLPAQILQLHLPSDSKLSPEKHAEQETQRLSNHELQLAQSEHMRGYK